MELERTEPKYDGWAGLRTPYGFTPTGDGGIVDCDNDRTLSGSKGPSFQDIKEITIWGSKLAKWFMGLSLRS